MYVKKRTVTYSNEEEDSCVVEEYSNKANKNARISYCAQIIVNSETTFF